MIHVPTAKAKANLHLQYRALPSNERKDFDLKGQLAALSGGEIEVVTDVVDDDEDLL